VEILLDEGARWCQNCPLIQQVEPEAREATCQDCRASDQNKDVVLEDPYFVRMWRGVQLKKAGIPVLELIEDLDDALVLQAIEVKVDEIHREQRETEREGSQRDRDE